MSNLVEMKAQSRALSNGILNPENLQEALQMAEVLCKSSLIPKDFQGNPGNVLVAIQWGLELGLAPMQALQSIAVINGRPSLWGDAVIALCKSHPVCEWIRETFDDDGTAVCTAKRRGDPEPVERRFSLDDAKKASLSGKPGPWTQYPRRMLQMRARSWCLRDAFPDLLRGMAVAEESQDMTDVVITEAPAPALSAPSSSLSRTEQAKSRLLAQQHRAKIAESLDIAGAMPPPDVDRETGEIREPDPLTRIINALRACQSKEEMEQYRADVADLRGDAKRQAVVAWRAQEAALTPAEAA